MVPTRFFLQGSPDRFFTFPKDGKEPVVSNRNGGNRQSLFHDDVRRNRPFCATGFGLNRKPITRTWRPSTTHRYDWPVMPFDEIENPVGHSAVTTGGFSEVPAARR